MYRITPSIVENMAPFDQLLFPHSVLHPTHVTLSDQQPSLRSLVHTIQDPYYNSNIQPFVKHHNVVSPLFDVRETDNAFFLEGEFPGVSGKDEILIEKLGPRTLLVESKRERYDLEKGWEEFSVKTEANGDLESGTANAKLVKHAHGQERHDDDDANTKEKAAIKNMLTERHVGTLQRSFTFPSAVDIGGLKARLRHGLLVMMVPKVRDEGKDLSRIAITD